MSRSRLPLDEGGVHPGQVPEHTPVHQVDADSGTAAQLLHEGRCRDGDGGSPRTPGPDGFWSFKSAIGRHSVGKRSTRPDSQPLPETGVGFLVKRMSVKRFY